MNTIENELKYVTNENSDSIELETNLIQEQSKDPGPQGTPPKYGTDQMLNPCECPQDFGQVKIIDAETKCRIVKFSIKVKNLCRGKEYLVAVVLYKWVWVWPHKWVRVPIAEDCKIAKFTGCDNCGEDIVYFKLAIKEPLCSGQYIGIDVTGNYINSCNL